MGTALSNDPPDPATPSWKELNEFIRNENVASRDLIDRWFTLASWVLGVLLIAISIGVGLFGWKTLGDARTTAEQTARAKATEVATTEAKKVAERVASQAADRAAKEAATAQVRVIMQDPYIQKLVQDTASQLFREGAYKRTIEQAVHEQMQTAIAEGVVGNYVVSVNGIPNQSLGITKKLQKH